MELYRKIAACLVMAVLVTTACKKTTTTPISTPPHPLTKQVYDQPLDTIKAYISGKWELVRSGGGFGSVYTDHTNTYIQISGNKFIRTENGVVKINTPIAWKNVSYIGGGSTYQMSGAVNPGWVFREIMNDTLYAHENVMDGFEYIMVWVGSQ